MTDPADGPVPVLSHDGTSLDWPGASYEVGVELSGMSGTVRHVLSGSPGIESLVASGDAAYAVEVRCPRTMTNRLECSSQASHAVALGTDGHPEDLYLVPGIVALKDTQMNAAGLSDLVRNGRPAVHVPAGWWIARGGEYRFNPLLMSLLRFARDSAGSLGPGMMSVSEATAPGSPYFRVTMGEALYARREERDVQMAALIAAFGAMPHSTMAEGSENADCLLAEALRQRLSESSVSVPDWDSEEFDPALAATSLEEFWPSAAVGP